jgi:hypothetical protein
LRRDGTVLEFPGYDPTTRILFDPRGVAFPPVPLEPSKEDARNALDELKEPFAEFPFVDDASRSVFLSGLLSVLARPAIKFVPCHAFDAPVAGTGKSKLVDCCAILALGHECPVTSQGDDETELEKRLGAHLLAGDRIIAIDNCDKPLGGQLLCQIITQLLVQVRILGLSKRATIPCNTSLFATGNNFQFWGDMLRRGLTGRLDAQTERPELRVFKREDPVELFRRERARFVVAVLTVLRAYIAAGLKVVISDLLSRLATAGWSSALSPGLAATGVLPRIWRTLPKLWAPSLPSPPSGSPSSRLWVEVVNSANHRFTRTMAKVGKSDGERTLRGTRGNDKVA